MTCGLRVAVATRSPHVCPDAVLAGTCRRGCLPSRVPAVAVPAVAGVRTLRPDEIHTPANTAGPLPRPGVPDLLGTASAQVGAVPGPGAALRASAGPVLVRSGQVLGPAGVR